MCLGYHKRVSMPGFEICGQEGIDAGKGQLVKLQKQAGALFACLGVCIYLAGTRSHRKSLSRVMI